MNSERLLIWIFVSILAFTSCSRALPKEEAEKHLKAFDNELIILSKQVSETMAYQAVHELFVIKNLPLPFQYTSSDKKESGAYVYDFETRKGIYQYNDTTHLVMRTGESDSLIILFPFESKMDHWARFILMDYKEEVSAFGIMFPTKLAVKIEIQDHSILELNSSTLMDHGFPVQSNTRIVFNKFRIGNQFETKLSRRKGVIHQKLVFDSGDKTVLDLSSRIVATLSEQKQLTFKKVEISGDIFPIHFTAKVNQGNIPPDALNFVEEFNANSNIEVFQQKGRKIGHVFLQEIPSVNRLNFTLRYSDGTTVQLQKLLFGFDEIMNMKL